MKSLKSSKNLKTFTSIVGKKNKPLPLEEVPKIELKEPKIVKKTVKK